MSRAGNLFPEPSTQIRVLRKSPAVWVRRVIIWESADKVLRNVSLHRGLNVVWSPDPGTKAAAVGTEGGIGHGVGKSLFCRLIRYCLGEETFADDDLRHLVASRFPDGHVGAEVVIDEITWSVIRPIGTSRGTIVSRESLTTLAAADGPTTGMQPLIDAIESASITPDVAQRMPGTRENRAWLVALAWMTRDQECRFGHHLEWRHTTAQSRSPALGLSKDDTLVAVRLLLRALLPEELAQRARNAEAMSLSERLQRKETELTSYVSRVQRELEEALQSLEMEGLEQVGAELLRSLATIRRDEIESSLDALDQAASDSTVDDQIEAAERDTVRLEQNLAALRLRRGLHEAERKQVQGELDKLTAAGIEARYGRDCPICGVPINEALAKGCALSHEPPDRQQVAADAERKGAELADHDKRLREEAGQLLEYESLLEAAQTRERDLRAKQSAAWDEARAAWRARRDEWSNARGLVRDAERLVAASAELPKTRSAIEADAMEEKARTELLVAHRKNNAATLSRWSALFNYICRGLLGPEANGGLSLTANSIRADLGIGGTAMRSLKSVAFDLSALLMTIEARACLPGILIHDSPREGDLGLSDYHRLFHLVSELEKLGDPAPFQYIVTTTTSPPEEIVRSDRIVLQLTGSEPAGRLLGCSL